MLLPIRKWRDIKGYEGKYQVSNLGEIRSLDYKHTGKTRILKPATDRYGYKTIGLCKNGKQKKFFIHRLVAEAFLLNPNGLLEVNHKDEDKANNIYSNLEWCTNEYNINYGTRNKRVSKPIKCITTGEIFSSMTEAGHKYNIEIGNITKCCHGRYKYAGKSSTGEPLIWKYIE